MIKGLIIFFGFLLSCSTQNEGTKTRSKIRKEIFGKEFSNNEVVSIDIVEIEHPLLGNILKTIKLNKDQKAQFLSDFDNLKKQGIRKCFSNYVVRLNLKSDTLRLKVCDNMVSNRNDDIYYMLPNERNFITDYLNQK